MKVYTIATTILRFKRLLYDCEDSVRIELLTHTIHSQMFYILTTDPEPLQNSNIVFYEPLEWKYCPLAW